MRKWSLQKLPSEFHCNNLYDDETGFIIASIHKRPWLFTKQDGCYSEPLSTRQKDELKNKAEAYQKLLTAAPKLLEACKEMCEWLEFMFGSQFAGEPTHRIAREAISEAEYTD